MYQGLIWEYFPKSLNIHKSGDIVFENMASYIKTLGQGWISVYGKIVLPVNVKISVCSESFSKANAEF